MEGFKLLMWIGLLVGVLVGLVLAGCVKRAPVAQIVCTRPVLGGKRVLVTVAPISANGETSERFSGSVETAVQTWLRGRGSHTVEEPPYDFHVFARVSESGDAPLGVATVTLKMITVGSEVVANGAGSAVYDGGARDGMYSDMQAVGRAARLAAENLCMTREREYLYTAPRPPQEIPPADPYPYPYPYQSGYAYGYMEAYPAPRHYYHGGYVRGGTISLPLPLPLLIYKAIKGDSGRERHRHDGRRHHGRNRHGGRWRR